MTGVQTCALPISAHHSVRDLDWLGFVTALQSVNPETVANAYLRLARPWRGREPRFVDKQPTNFYYCGLILAAFPNARIVHLTRHPLAAVHAIYKTYFPRTYPFSYQLDELADYYVGYHRLMAHWHRLHPGAILDLAYEDIVSSQEESTRRLLDFCGLPFDAACLQFEKNEASDRKSTRLNSSHIPLSRMPSSA